MVPTGLLHSNTCYTHLIHIINVDINKIHILIFIYVPTAGYWKYYYIVPISKIIKNN